MSDLDLSGYKVTFQKGMVFATWGFEIQCPDGTLLRNFGLHPTKESAERQALRFTEAHAMAETVDGSALRERLAPREAK